MAENNMQVLGATILGFSQACINLKFIAGSETSDLLNGIKPNEWYPFSTLKKLEKKVKEKYENPGPIMEKVGEEMMMGWYHHGPGKEIIKTGVDFLHFQTGSEGYYSVINGPAEKIGDFRLEKFDLENGSAKIISSTPFDKNLEKGVLLGGMKAPNDLDYIDINNDKNKNIFEITFYK